MGIFDDWDKGLRDAAKEVEAEGELQCNCDLDRWQPARSTGHSWVCRIHRQAMTRYKRLKGLES